MKRFFLRHKTLIIVLLCGVIAAALFFVLFPRIGVRTEGRLVYGTWGEKENTVLVAVNTEDIFGASSELRKSDQGDLNYPSLYKGKLVYVQTGKNNNSDLIVSDGKNEKTVYQTSFWIFFPRFIDDTHIVYLRYKTGIDNTCVLETADITAKTTRILADNAAFCGISVSDGKILFSDEEEAADGNFCNICVCDLQGNCRKITKGRTAIWLNGSSARFIYNPSEKDEICLYDIATGNSKTLYKGEKYEMSDLALSPDGKYLAYYRGGELIFDDAIWQLSLDTGKIYKVCDITYNMKGMVWMK